jgi:hypothetical protein
MRTILYYAAQARGFLLKPYARSVLKLERKRLRTTALEPVSEAQRIEAADLAVDWLMRARKFTVDGGFPTFDLALGFGSSYPETTGYILDTLLRYDQRFPGKISYEELNEIRLFLLKIQHNEGGWQSGYVDENKPPVAFNTAQVMRGLITWYNRFPDEEVALALDRAAQWLTNVQEADGSWSKHNYMGMARVYDSYVSAPLVQWAMQRSNEDWKNAAAKNIDWVISNQQENAWFANADNTEKHNSRPILHTIAYTIDGLLEYAQVTGDTKARESGEKAALVLADKVLTNKRLGGRFDEQWNASEATIITGCAQMCVAWNRMPESTKAMEAKAIMQSWLVFWQWKSEKLPADMKGAFSGSFPFWGKYEPFRCPNWAVKYAIDALLNF